jgi:hypothetical protein
MNPYEQPDIDILSESLIDELVGAVGLPKTRVYHWFFHKAFSRITDSLARIGVPFNRLVREEGLPAASRWVLKKFCNSPLNQGVQNIPKDGPLLVMSNHPGAYDALVLFSLIDRQDIKWISSEIPFLDLLPDTKQHILFASRKDSTQGMVILRQVIAHLKQGGTIVYFGAGHRDPDPAVYPGAENAITGWLPVVDLFFRAVPDLRIQPSILSGVVSEKWVHHPITRLRRKQIDKHRLAEFGQVITQLMRPEKFFVTPAVSFGKTLMESEISKETPEGSLHAAVVEKAKKLLREHIQEFHRTYS